MPKYIDYLKDEKVKLKEKHENAAKIAQKQLELQISQQEVELEKANDIIRESKGSYPLNTEKILNAVDDAAVLERRLTALQALHKELF